MTPSTNPESVGLTYESQLPSAACSAGVEQNVYSEAAHPLKALAMPAAGAASEKAPSAETPGAAAAAAAMQGSTAQRSGHLAPPGGHAEAAAPAAGRWWEGGGFIAVGLRLAGERVLQLVEAIGAAVRRSLAWRPRGATAETPSPRRAGGPPPAAGMGRPPHIPAPPPAPGNQVAPNATRRPTP